VIVAIPIGRNEDVPLAAKNVCLRLESGLSQIVQRRIYEFTLYPILLAYNDAYVLVPIKSLIGTHYPERHSLLKFFDAKAKCERHCQLNLHGLVLLP
jgi:hypothetical protein